jgi:hypothetical protein
MSKIRQIRKKLDRVTGFARKDVAEAVTPNVVYVVEEGWNYETHVGPVFLTKQDADKYVKSLYDKDKDGFNQAFVRERELHD